MALCWQWMPLFSSDNCEDLTNEMIRDSKTSHRSASSYLLWPLLWVLQFTWVYFGFSQPWDDLQMLKRDDETFKRLNNTFLLLRREGEYISNKPHSCSVQDTQVFCCYSLTGSGVTSSLWWETWAKASKLTLVSHFADFTTLVFFF